MFIRAFSAIVRGEIIRLARIWRQTLLPPLISSFLFFVVFGQVIGSRIGQTSGVPYMTFIAPGLIIMGIIQAAYGHVVFALFSAKYQKSIEEFLIAPVPNWVIIVGYVSAGILRSLIIGSLLTLMASCFTVIPFTNPVLLVVTILLTSSALALAGFANALFAKKFDDVSVVSDFILTPLTYFAGVFYAVERLSPLLQKISLFNPLLYIVQTVRTAFIGTGASSPAVTLFVLLGLNIFLFFLDLFLLRRRIGLSYG